MLGAETILKFRQHPKVNCILSGHYNWARKSTMIGDGLNDAGALKTKQCRYCTGRRYQQFHSPASDAIMAAKQLERLPAFIRLLQGQQTDHTLSALLVSILYNIIGFLCCTGIIITHGSSLH